jgi:hypothetical protein
MRLQCFVTPATKQEVICAGLFVHPAIFAGLVGYTSLRSAMLRALQRKGRRAKLILPDENVRA